MRRRTSISVPALVVGFFLAGSLLGPMPALAAPPPVITKFNPKSGIVGTEVTITGTGLAGATSVTFNGTPDSTFIVDSATKIAAHVPFGATTGPISVTTPVGTATSAANFTVIASPAIGLTPTAGPPGSSISVAGSGFGAFEPVDLYFDITDEALASTDGSGNFSMSMPVPPDALPGTHWVTAVGRRTLTSFQAAFVVRTNWSQYRNTRQRTARNPNERILNAANVDGLDTKWSFTTGANIEFSSPAVANGVVYEGADDGKLYALDASTGSLLWSFPTGGFIWSSPAVAKGIVYVGSADGKVYALKASSGAMVWSFATSGLVIASPVVTNGTVYVGSDDGTVYALAAGNGALRWSFATGGPVRSSPAVSSSFLFFGSDDGNTYGLQRSNGALLWSWPTGPIRSAPAVSGTSVYVTSENGRVYALTTTGYLRWSFNTSYDIEASPAVANGVVYVANFSGDVFALSARTGTQNWSVSTGASLTYSSPAVANGVVYLAAGPLWGFDASTGDAVWSFFDGEFGFASPVITDGVVYEGFYGASTGVIRAFDLAGDGSRVERPNPSDLQPDRGLRPSL
jgi:outer membrane protein assembly factor BamB